MTMAFTGSAATKGNEIFLFHVCYMQANTKSNSIDNSQEAAA